jgi:L-ascorbate metabolism protein UlaG (beta-lactamase superfamily)
VKIRHYLYNAFIIKDNNTKIAIDPGRNLWLFRLNSLIPKSEWEGVTHVCITHGDPDHFDYAIPMAKETGAAVVCGEGLEEALFAGDVGNVHPIAVGGVATVKGVTVEGLKAKHGPLPVKLAAGLLEMKNIVIEGHQGNQGGQEIFLGPLKIHERKRQMQVRTHGTVKLFFGLLRFERDNVPFARGSIGLKMTIGEKTIVNLGDTVLQEAWEDLQPDVLMIPIGGREIPNTMDEKEALKAVRLIQPKLVLPMHYNGDLLWKRNGNPADDAMFKREVEKMGIECVIMKYGDRITL